MIFVIEDNEIMARCLARMIRRGLTKKCDKGASASEIAEKEKTGKASVLGSADKKEVNKASASEIADKIGGDGQIKIFHNAYEAMEGLTDEVPELIFLDILLDGVDGFTFLHEIMSYEDTAKIPIILVTSLEMKDDLSVYGVRGILNKETMTPREIERYVKKYTK